jgi:(1->4)-alpha-D-glucan 1-alpha-D-glucosylmutase
MHISDAGPSRADQYLFFQTLAALWHGSDHAELVERLWLYMQKATRESKRQTSWTNPDEAYEEALEAFVKGMLEDDRVAETLDDLSRRLAHIGFHNTLSQVILKLTTPGLPDIYQGCELLDLSLVDPDNRRPVDYDQRARALESLGGLIANPDVTRVRSLLKSSAFRVQDSESNVERSDATGESLRIDFNGLGEWEIAKLYVTAALLQLRRKEPELLAGDYFPVDVESSEHWIVFSRTNAEKALLVVVGRWHTAWGENSDAAISLPSQISDRTWTDVLTGALIEAGSTLSLNDLPMRWAVLIS